MFSLAAIAILLLTAVNAQKSTACESAPGRTRHSNATVTTVEGTPGSNAGSILYATYGTENSRICPPPELNQLDQARLDINDETPMQIPNE